MANRTRTDESRTLTNTVAKAISAPDYDAERIPNASPIARAAVVEESRNAR